MHFIVFFDISLLESFHLYTYFSQPTTKDFESTQFQSDKAIFQVLLTNEIKCNVLSSQNKWKWAQLKNNNSVKTQYECLRRIHLVENYA